MTDVERMVREVLDEPAPPPPPEPVEDQDDGDGHHVHVHCPLVIVLADGSMSANGWAGALLVGWCHLASFVTIAIATWWLWSSLSTAGLVGLLAAASVAVGMLVGWVTDRRLPRRDQR